MFKTILVFLRITDHNMTGKDQPDHVLLKWKRTKWQDDVFWSILTYIQDTNLLDYLGDTPLLSFQDYDLRLDKNIHEMLEATFYTTVVSTTFIGHPLDIAIILLSLADDGSFHKASYVTHFCAVEQHWARSTVVHSLRLHACNSKIYVPYVSGHEDNSTNDSKCRQILALFILSHCYHDRVGC